MLSEQTQNSRVFSVRDYGAVGDGVHLDTIALNTSIQACALAGGGRVLVPSGTYLTGPIELKSHVELHLEAGATVLFSRDFDHYPLCITNFEGNQTVTCRSPLWGENLTQVAITGAGTFDGQGDAWRPVKKFKMPAAQWQAIQAGGGVLDAKRDIWWPTQAAMEGEQLARQLRSSGRAPIIDEYRPARDFLRPNMVKFAGCRDVTIDGPTFQNSPCWTVHFFCCQNVAIRNVTILNPWYAQNADGFDIESCRDVVISDCFLDVGDDAICLKSGKDEEGRRRGLPCENIIVERCTVIHGHGGLTIGSEMSGGVRNVQVSECVFRGTDVGLRFKTMRGRGGIVENIEIRDITMSEISGAAISFDMYYMGTAWGESAETEASFEAVNEGTPQFRHIAMRNVTCSGAKRALELRGLPEMPLANISLENAHIKAEEGAMLSYAQDITLREVQIETASVPALRCHQVTRLTMERVEYGAEVRPLEQTAVSRLESVQV